MINTRQVWNDDKVTRDTQELEALRQERGSWASCVRTWKWKHGQQDSVISQMIARHSDIEGQLEALRQLSTDNAEAQSAAEEL